MPVYRYRSISLDPTRLTLEVPGATLLGPTGPDTFVDISADAPAKDDLDEFMRSQGFQYWTTNPVPTPEEEGSQSVIHSELQGLTLGNDHSQYSLIKVGNGNPNVLGIIGPVGAIYRDQLSNLIYHNYDGSTTGWVVT